MLATTIPILIPVLLAVFALIIILRVGGDAGGIRTPWPKGDDSIVPLIFPGLTLAAAGNHVSFTMPFSAKCVYAEVSGQIAAGGTLNVQDDTATPKKWVNAVATGTLAAGAMSGSLAVDKTVEIFQGAIVTIAIGTAAATNAAVILWVRPTH